ncbi:MAG: hypothetical protein ACXW2E_01950 [Nitrososphaeraceae archaeon]
MRIFNIKPISETFQHIFESKDVWLAKTYGDNLIASAQREGSHIENPIEIIQQLKVADPTKGKYLAFLAKAYAAKQFRLEDTTRLKETLMLFDKVKHKLPNKDIMSYAKLSDIYNALAPFQEKDTQASGKELKRQIKSEGAKTIIDTPKFKVIQPLTVEAACFYGANTHWCTAGKNDNRFEQYNKQGPLYIILAGDRKFQLQYESDQFVDEQDEELSQGDINYLSDNFPEYKSFLEMLIKKHYNI